MLHLRAQEERTRCAAKELRCAQDQVDRLSLRRPAPSRTGRCRSHLTACSWVRHRDLPGTRTVPRGPQGAGRGRKNQEGLGAQTYGSTALTCGNRKCGAGSGRSRTILKGLIIRRPWVRVPPAPPLTTREACTLRGKPAEPKNGGHHSKVVPLVHPFTRVQWTHSGRGDDAVDRSALTPPSTPFRSPETVAGRPMDSDLTEAAAGEARQSYVAGRRIAYEALRSRR